MALNFPLNPAAQTPPNTYGPTTTPVANTVNNLTYFFDGSKWSTTGSPPFVLRSGDTMSGNLTLPTLNATSVVTTNVNGGSLAGLRNRIINGNFIVDQRSGGSSVTITAGSALGYTADRFYAYCTGANVSGQRITVAGPEPDPFRYQFTGTASVTGIGIGQRIEAANCRDLAGKTVTLSVNLSNSLLTTVNWQAFYANTNDTFGSLASPTRTSIASGSFTVNGTYSRYSTQIAIPAAATTGIEIVFTVGAQTSGTWVIGQVQLEEGSVATPFEQRPAGLELMLCQRYYSAVQVTARFPATAGGQSTETPIYWPVNMRTTATTTGPTGGAGLNLSSGSVASATFGGARFILTSAAAGDCYLILGNVTASAEL